MPKQTPVRYTVRFYRLKSSRAALDSCEVFAVSRAEAIKLATDKKPGISLGCGRISAQRHSLRNEPETVKPRDFLGCAHSKGTLRHRSDCAECQAEDATPQFRPA